jgi:hypothetical protein
MGSSCSMHREKQYMPLIGDLDMVVWPGTAPTQCPHSLHLSPDLPLIGI